MLTSRLALRHQHITAEAKANAKLMKPRLLTFVVRVIDYRSLRVISCS
jgi:hypothetical protein